MQEDKLSEIQQELVRIEIKLINYFTRAKDISKAKNIDQSRELTREIREIVEETRRKSDGNH